MGSGLQHNFDAVIDRTRSRSAKYDEQIKLFGAEQVIPLRIADMDLQTAGPSLTQRSAFFADLFTSERSKVAPDLSPIL